MAEHDEEATLAKDKPKHEDVRKDASGVSMHPRAMGAPSGSINDPEYRNAAIENGEGIDDDNPATVPGFPVPVLKKTEHAKALHETAAHDVVTTNQADRATELAGGDTGDLDNGVKLSDPFGGSVELGTQDK